MSNKTYAYQQGDDHYGYPAKLYVVGWFYKEDGWHCYKIFRSLGQAKAFAKKRFEAKIKIYNSGEYVGER
jgi:hypothetical protein